MTGYQSAASPGSSAHSKARRSSWSAAGSNARRRFGTVHRTDNLGMHGIPARPVGPPGTQVAL